MSYYYLMGIGRPNDKAPKAPKFFYMKPIYNRYAQKIFDALERNNYDPVYEGNLSEDLAWILSCL